VGKDSFVTAKTHPPALRAAPSLLLRRKEGLEELTFQSGLKKLASFKEIKTHL